LKPTPIVPQQHNDSFFLTSLMADVILLESSVPFDAAEWIGVGKLYKDVPIEVSDACCDARKIPVDLQATFPSRATPITGFLALQLPVILDGYQAKLIVGRHSRAKIGHRSKKMAFLGYVRPK
jgi:hypothetical protein